MKLCKPITKIEIEFEDDEYESILAAKSTILSIIETMKDEKCDTIVCTTFDGEYEYSIDSLNELVDSLECVAYMQYIM